MVALGSEKAWKGQFKVTIARKREKDFGSQVTATAKTLHQLLSVLMNFHEKLGSAISKLLFAKYSKQSHTSSPIASQVTSSILNG